MHDIILLLANWLLLYGAPILFILLFLGIVGLPIVDETILILSGWLVAKGYLAAIPIITAAITGSICGISFSYWLGRNTGTWLINKYGPKIKITPERLLKVHIWYNMFGKWLLLIGYYIPLVRHLMGYTAGSLNLNLKQFCIFAFAGAIIWSLTFLSLGYFFF